MLRSTSQSITVVSQELSRGCECIIYFFFYCKLYFATHGSSIPDMYFYSNNCASSLLVVLGSTWYNLLRGVLEVAGGMVAGILLGFIIQYFPSVDQVGVLLQPYHDI